MILDVFDCTIDDSQRALSSLGLNSATIALEPAGEVRSAGFALIVAHSAVRLVHSDLQVAGRGHTLDK
jgi:hypothetical protein